ncbi:MAG: hypothetical protein WBL20_08795 [Sphingobium sp.]|uniref:hypothetical protein n=1 Tax=Sphingobium sp. TaxID=1912891 RepID=UPI003BB1D461
MAKATRPAPIAPRANPPRALARDTMIDGLADHARPASKEPGEPLDRRTAAFASAVARGKDRGAPFPPRSFEDHAKGLRVVDRSSETGPAFRPLGGKFVSQTATSIEVDNSQADGDPIDFADGDAEDAPVPE